MKVTDLFEAQGSPGQGGKLKGGAHYRPSYDAETKTLRGSVADWLDSAGITKDDVHQAVALVKGDPIIGKMREAGLSLENKPDSEKRGTLVFRVKRHQKMYHSGKVREFDSFYQVYANGQIRYSGTSPYAPYMGKLKSPKPRLKAGDPVASLVKTYKQALEELLSKWSKSRDNPNRAE